MKIYKVYFDNSQFTREIGRTRKYRKTFNIIHAFLRKKHYKVYYERVWPEEDYIKVDVGSHTQFFLIKEEVI